MSLLAALAAIPKIAASLEALAAAVGNLNDHLVRVDAERRRGRKDEQVDSRIDGILAGDSGVRDGEAGEQPTPDGEA